MAGTRYSSSDDVLPTNGSRMIDAFRLVTGWALPWLLGVALLAALRRRAGADREAGEVAWILGCGWFVGTFALTLWMRALSWLGAAFSVAAIGLPLAVGTIALAALAWRRARNDEYRVAVSDAWNELRGVGLSASARALWFALLLWLVLRSLLLLVQVVWIPLYPWDAWIQWATKARVWYELGHIVPFARTDPWFAADGSAWFDASPSYPATVPLWQVWSNLALGRWDDALMNLPWWLLAVAFTFAVYGALRRAGMEPLGALIGAWLVSSLPLANVHVALAGYADLPMAAYYALAAIAVWRWTSTRTATDAVLACVLAVACALTKTPGIVWALTLIPGAVFAAFPRHGLRIVSIGLLVALAALLTFARTEPVLLGYRLHLDFAPAWSGLLDSLFLLGNWHLLWYATLAVAALAGREIIAQALAPLTLIVITGVIFLLVVFAFTNARDWVTDQSTVNRATLHLAPLLTFWMLVAFRAWLRRLRASAAATAPSSAG
jgi:hypothetical protein